MVQPEEERGSRTERFTKVLQEGGARGGGEADRGDKGRVNREDR
jgi:hypothetical protein